MLIGQFGLRLIMTGEVLYVEISVYFFGSLPVHI